MACGPTPCPPGTPPPETPPSLVLPDSFNCWPRDEPELEMVVASDTRNCELCGFYEYNNLSTPPKRYLRATYEGVVEIERRDVLIPAFGNPPGWGCFDAGSSHINFVTETFSGQAHVSNSTCLYLTKANINVVDEVSGTTNIQIPAGVPDDLIPFVIPPNGCEDDYTTVPITSTVFYRTQTGNCCVVGLSGLGYPQFVDIVTGYVQTTLSEEDTDANAIARASSTPNTFSIAKYEARTEFDFLWQSVSVVFNLSELTVSNIYRITLPITTENYGGGGGIASAFTYDIVAGATTETISDLIIADRGKQITLGTPVVSIL